MEIGLDFRRLPKGKIIRRNKSGLVRCDELGCFMSVALFYIKKWNGKDKTYRATAGTYTKWRTKIFFVVVVGMVGS